MKYDFFYDLHKHILFNEKKKMTDEILKNVIQNCFLSINDSIHLNLKWNYLYFNTC